MRRIARVAIVARRGRPGGAAPAAAQLPADPDGDPARPDRPADRRAGARAAGLPGQRRRAASATSCRPGTRGRYNAPELAAFLATGATRARTAATSSAMYRDLVYATPGPAGRAASRTTSRTRASACAAATPSAPTRPRADVTIVRDKGFGVPHVYGTTRDGAMFGLGYVGAEDRLFFMDVLRHAGRGAAVELRRRRQHRRWTREQWEVAPYTEADLAAAGRPARRAPRRRRARRSQRDVDNYIAGINQYIAEAQARPDEDAGRVRRDRPAAGPGPVEARPTSSRPPSLVGGIFGKGGGNELAWSQVADALEAASASARGDARVPRLPRGRGPRGAGHRAAASASPTRRRPKRPARRVARPDRGSLQARPAVASRAPRERGARPGLLALLAFPHAHVQRAAGLRRASRPAGHPLMVAGPQVAYFNPQILMEQDVHAPAAPAPGIDARGAAFVGVNLYVQLGRGRDYAWSATSAGQDIIDTFAVTCASRRRQADGQSTHYRFRGQCLPIEVLEQDERWIADARPTRRRPGTQTLRAERTKLGLVAGRGTVRGKPVAVHQAALDLLPRGRLARAGFMDFNTPEQGRATPGDFQRAASKIGYTFNWFYADSEHIAYFNSGANPVRAKRRRPRLPGARARSSSGSGWNPDTWHGDASPPFAQHPQAIDQRYLDQLEQQAGARLPRRRTRTSYSSDVPLAAARGPRSKRAIARRAQD